MPSWQRSSRRHRRRRRADAFAAARGFAPSRLPFEDGVSLRFVIARSVAHADTPAALGRFGAQLGDEIGEPVTVEIVASYGALRAALADGGADLGWLPPLVLSDSAD